ncbi:hypothetical protein [Pseudomonas kulmbachensis]|uniref:hypothetical protein n=1 Tax=Pseudomonas kulmbachensis TaxID=3043408 RepID=UPI002AB221B5|nr:hypothetical protein [Pseudomonas sp. V3/3/4/13]
MQNQIPGTKKPPGMVADSLTLCEADYMQTQPHINTPSSVATRFADSENVSRNTMSSRETQPHWYVDRFLELAALVGKA